DKEFWFFYLIDANQKSHHTAAFSFAFTLKIKKITPKNTEIDNVQTQIGNLKESSTILSASPSTINPAQNSGESALPLAWARYSSLACRSASSLVTPSESLW